MSAISITVYGLPRPAGSKRAYPVRRRDASLGVSVADANPQSREWKAMVASQAIACVGPRFTLLDGPLALNVLFVLPRPRGHFRSGKHAGMVRDSAPAWPAVRPDLLKLTRAVEDALTGVVWRDDAQIVQQHLEKRYGDPAQARIVVESMAGAFGPSQAE